MPAIKTKRRGAGSARRQKRSLKSGAPWRLRRSGLLQILEAAPFAKLDWLIHGFSTLGGGVSEFAPPPKRSSAARRVLNLGFTDWDTRERVSENRNRFFKAIGAARMRIEGLRQIHSDIAICIDSAAGTSSRDILSGDALITRESGVLLTVQTADCVPILLADPDKRVVAAVHSGWCGTLQRIVEKAIGRMRMEFGTRPADLLAAVGPSIGGCCYEVGHEVVKEFAAKFPDARDWFTGSFDGLADGDNDPNWLPWLTMKPPGHAPPPPRAYLDLKRANCKILMTAGVRESNISVSDFCTACCRDLFFSYRRDRITGRMMAAIGIRA